MAEQIKNFFLSNNNVSMIYQVINQNLQKRNFNVTNEIKQKLQDIQQNIMNMVYQSKDYYLQLENVTNNSEKIKILNRKVIDRCNIEFANVLEKSTQSNDNKNNTKTENTNTTPQTSQIPQTPQSQPYKTTDYSKISVDDAFSKLMAARKIDFQIPKTNPTPNPIPTKIQSTQPTNNKTNNKTNINFYDMDSQIQKIMNKNENENKNENSKQKSNQNSNQNSIIENIKLKIEKRKNDLKQSNTTKPLINNNLQTKINEFKQIQKQVAVPNTTLQNTNKVIHKLHYSVNKEWGGFWNLKKEKNIIINRELVVSPHNIHKFTYFIKNDYNIKRLAINQVILPINRSNPNNIDLMIWVEIKNLQIKIPLYFYKQVQNLLYYKPNQTNFLNTRSIQTNKHLLIGITNHLQKQLKEKDVFVVKSLTINENTKHITLEFNENLSYQNKIINNDTIIFKNINLRNFIKYNQTVTKEKIKQLEDWLINKEHMVFLIENSKIVIEIDDDDLHWLENSIAKTTINEIKKQNIGVMLNKTTQHLIDFSFM